MSDTHNSEWSIFWSRPGDPGHNTTHRHADNLGTVVYTEATTQEPQLDGTVEHSPVRVLVNGKRPKPADDSNLPDHLAGLTPQQRSANQRNYVEQVSAARSVIPDLDTVAYQERVQLPPVALHMLAQGGLANSARIQNYLGQHPAVAEGMFGLTDKQVQDVIKDLDVRLTADHEGMEADKSDFRTFVRFRNRKLQRGTAKWAATFNYQSRHFGLATLPIRSRSTCRFGRCSRRTSCASSNCKWASSSSAIRLP